MPPPTKISKFSLIEIGEAPKEKCLDVQFTPHLRGWAQPTTSFKSPVPGAETGGLAAAAPAAQEAWSRYSRMWMVHPYPW